MDINVKKTEIINLSNGIGQCNQDFVVEIGHLQTMVDNISTVWTGVDAEKYKTLMESMIKGLYNFSGLITEYNNYLSKVSGLYDTFDDTYSSKII